MGDTNSWHSTDEYWQTFTLRLVACGVAIVCIFAGSMYLR